VIRLNDPNRVILSRVGRALGELREALVFVGGCSTGLPLALLGNCS
jgi:hypothetical protein